MTTAERLRLHPGDERRCWSCGARSRYVTIMVPGIGEVRVLVCPRCDGWERQS